jgi:hypothetical protein
MVTQVLIPASLRTLTECAIAELDPCPRDIRDIINNIPNDYINEVCNFLRKQPVGVLDELVSTDPSWNYGERLDEAAARLCGFIAADQLNHRV